MSQNAVLTQGTLLQRGDGGSPEVFTTIPEVLSISGPDATKSEIRVSDMSSSAEEYRGGLADFGRTTVELYFRGTLAIHQTLLADFQDTSSPVRNWRLVFVDGKRLDFAASVFSFQFSGQANDAWKVSMVLRMTGSAALV